MATLPAHLQALVDLLVEAKQLAPPTAAQRREQAIDFAYGNAHLSNPAVTREMVEKAYAKAHPDGCPCGSWSCASYDPEAP